MRSVGVGLENICVTFFREKGSPISVVYVYGDFFMFLCNLFPLFILSKRKKSLFVSNRDSVDSDCLYMQINSLDKIDKF